MYNYRVIIFKVISAILASVLGAIFFIPYIRNIFARKTEPHIYSWLIWSILQMVGTIIMFRGGARLGVLWLFIESLSCFFVFLLSFKYGTKNITKFDTICLFGALIAIFIYVFLHNPLLSIITISLIDFVGFLPTFRKSYEEPQTETASVYIASAFSYIFGILALSSYTLTTTFYLTSLMITNATCWLIIVLRRRKLRLK